MNTQLSPHCGWFFMCEVKPGRNVWVIQSALSWTGRRPVLPCLSCTSSRQVQPATLFKQQCQGEADVTCQLLSLALLSSGLPPRVPNLPTTGHSSRLCLMARTDLSHLGTLFPLWGGSSLWVGAWKICWAQEPQDSLGQYSGQHRAYSGTQQLHRSPRRPLHTFGGPPVWGQKTQKPLPSLQGKWSVLEHRTPSLVSCKAATLLMQRHHSASSTSGLTWLWQKVLIPHCCIVRLESLCPICAFQMMLTSCRLPALPAVWGNGHR